jgi:hypothetical protein
MSAFGGKADIAKLAVNIRLPPLPGIDRIWELSLRWGRPQVSLTDVASQEGLIEQSSLAKPDRLCSLRVFCNLSRSSTLGHTKSIRSGA